MSTQDQSTMKIIFITFVECVLKGGWKDQPTWDIHYYTAKDDLNEIWIVRPDELKRGFRFKTGSQIKIVHNVLKFDNDDMLEELAIDEDEREGKVPLSKLDFN